MSKTFCGEHDWDFEPGDFCPICEGIRLERERVKGLSAEVKTYDAEEVELIKKYSRAYGVAEERERIVKVLSDVKTNQEFWAGIDFALELIKGEVNTSD